MQLERKISQMSHEELKLYQEQLNRELDRVKFYLQKSRPSHKRIGVKRHK